MDTGKDYGDFTGKSQRDGTDESRGMGANQADSKGTKDEGSEGTADSDCSREYQADPGIPYGAFVGSRQEIIGGILRQLRSLQAAHLAYVQAHKERLEQRLNENEKHQSKIAQEMEALERVVVKLLEFEDNDAAEDEEE